MEYIQDNTKYIVGKSAENNWKIIADADKSYYWIHANNIPSTHVIICIDVEPLKSEIEYACSLCKKHTKAISSTIKTIDYIGTQISNIKLGSKQGEVTFKNYNKCQIYSV